VTRTRDRVQVGRSVSGAVRAGAACCGPMALVRGCELDAGGADAHRRGRVCSPACGPFSPSCPRAQSCCL
jgi:hypothetical protein